MRVCICLGGVIIEGNYFSCKEKQILRRMLFFIFLFFKFFSNDHENCCKFQSGKVKVNIINL